MPSFASRERDGLGQQRHHVDQPAADQRDRERELLVEAEGAAQLDLLGHHDDSSAGVISPPAMPICTTTPIGRTTASAAGERLRVAGGLEHHVEIALVGARSARARPSR